MMLLDTNVVSEPLQPAQDARVIEKMDIQPPGMLFLSAIAVAELRAGVALLPPSKRNTGLLRKLGDARAVGLAIASADGYIAAIAAANGLVIATHVSAFKVAGSVVINLWQA